MHAYLLFSNAPSVPLITEKGEGDLLVSVAREGAHFQTSYGFTNSIAAFTNIQIGPSREWNGNRQISTDQYEMMLGVFSGKRRFTVWELYAMGGLGRIQKELPKRNGLFGPQSMGGALDANFWRYGFQLNYGLKRDNVEFAVSNRFFLKTYYNISGDLIFENVPQVDFLRINNRHFYWEPAFTFKYGWRNFKIFIHTIVSGNITDPDFYRLGSNGMIGVSYQW